MTRLPLSDIGYDSRMTRMTSVIVAGFLSLLGSVAIASPDIAIIELGTGNKAYPPSAERRQVVVRLDAASINFTTLVQAKGSLALQTYDRGGRLLGRETIRQFTEGYAGSLDYAFSADGRRIVYKKGYERDLYLLDIASDKETLLWPDAVTKYGPDIQGLHWVADDTVVALLGPRDASPGQEARSGEVTLVNVLTGARRTLHRPVAFMRGTALSPDRRWLVFLESLGRYSIYSKIRVLDLHSGEIVATLGSGTQLLGPLQWSPDGAELAFVEGNKLNVWRRVERQTRLLKVLDDEFLVYYLVFAPGQVGYVGEYSSKKRGWLSGLYGGKDLVMVDVASGQTVSQIREQFNGRLFYLAGCECIVAEVGI